MRTKWQILQERRDVALTEARLQLEKAQGITRDLEWAMQTPFKIGGSDEFGSCSTCGAVHTTEKDFWDHYVIPDERYLNLGNCPTKEKK